MNQHEITERRPLLDASGNLTEPGYAKSLLPVYRRGDIKANKLRIKEWDYYCINNGHFALALTIADNSYMGLDSISLLNLDEGWEITKSPMKAFTNGKVCLPESSERGDVHSAGRNYSILFKNEGDRRVLIAQMKNFGPEGALYAKVTLTDIPAESMVIATPFDKDKHFYYNQKINCMRAEGTVTYGYHNRTYTFDPADSFAVLDWGRGVWTYKNTWYWGSASGLVDGSGSASTSATASATRAPRARTCSFTRAGRTSSARSSSTSQATAAGPRRTICGPGPSRATTAASRWTTPPCSTARAVRTWASSSPTSTRCLACSTAAPCSTTAWC